MLEPINEHGTKELWLTSERGTIDDFEDLDEAIADGAVKNAKELNDWWLDLFPEEEQWYHLMAGEADDIGYRSIFINNRQIIEVDSTKEHGYEHDISEFLEWMLSAVKRCIDELKDGTYNERINKGVPYEYRIGTIVRNDLYDIFPDLREQFFADISKTEISELSCKCNSLKVWLSFARIFRDPIKYVGYLFIIPALEQNLLDKSENGVLIFA
jgi:hypothetical protein